MVPIRPRKVLILGYGALGKAFFRGYNAEYEIRGVKRGPLPDHPCPLVLMPIQSEALRPLVRWADVIIFCPSSGRGGLAHYRETYLDNMLFLLEQIARQNPPHPRLVLIGSTGVYPRSQDKTWTEEDTLPVESERQEILLSTEQALATSTVPFTILRSGGLYSPSRGYFYRYIREGQIFTSELSDQWVLSVHQDDLCGVIHRVIEQVPKRTDGEIYNVVDDSKLRRRDLARWISRKKGVPIIPDGPAPAVPERRVSNQKVKDVLGYAFLYPSITTYLENPGNNPAL